MLVQTAELRSTEQQSKSRKKSKKKKHKHNKKEKSKDHKTKSKHKYAEPTDKKSEKNSAKKTKEDKKRKHQTDENSSPVVSKKSKTELAIVNETDNAYSHKKSSKKKTNVESQRKSTYLQIINEESKKVSKNKSKFSKKDPEQKSDVESGDSLLIPIEKTKYAKKKIVRNTTLEKFLTVDVHEIPTHLFKDFRHSIFEPMKFRDIVKKPAEVSRSAYKNVYSDLTKKEVYRILYTKLLKHKWGDVALILENLAYVQWNEVSPKFTTRIFCETTILLKAGREVLLNHPCSPSNESLLRAHVEAMNSFKGMLDQSHIAIEDAFYSIVKHDFEKAREKLLSYEMSKKRDRFSEKHRQNALAWKNVAEAYLGILDYCKWHGLVSHDGGDTLPSSCDDSYVKTDVQVAGEIMKHFKTLWQAEGIWDIAMLKHIEVLLHYYKFEMIQEDLSSYSANHEENPNAHRYLYFVLKSYVSECKSTKKLKKKALKRLHNVSPSDPVLIDFYSLKFEKAAKKEGAKSENTKKFLKSLTILLNLLDYPSNMMKVEPWEKLQNGLKSSKKTLTDECFSDLVKRLWVKSGRSSWWPRFHFTTNQAQKTVSHENQKYVNAKVFVAKVFMGRHCEFCKRVLEHLE